VIATMFARLLLLFALVPLIELLVLIKIGQHVGIGITILFVLAMGMLGASLVRYEGLRTFRGIQADLSVGRLPGDRVIDAMIILVAGVLMITPGVITDAFGLLLLLPPCRRFVRERLKRRFQSRIVTIHHRGFHRHDPDDLIDVEAKVEE